MPSFPFPDTNQRVFGFIVVALIVGIGYWFLLGRTRFGFDLKASGLNPTAAVASGVNAKKMVIATMLISGAVAGLVGLPGLLGREHAVTTSVGGGLGFTGIAIALLGRNHPVGIALAALLWAFLDRTRIILDLEQIPQETIVIMQSITVLAVVVMSELAMRYSRRQQQHRVGRATGEAVRVTPEVPPDLSNRPGVEPAPHRQEDGA
jgi:simple sugar transport system permease protein